jgi:hypothetical protein
LFIKNPKEQVVNFKGMDNTLRILGFAGSLRAGSYNKALLNAAADFIHEGVDLEILILAAILHSTGMLRGIRCLQ